MKLKLIIHGTLHDKLEDFKPLDSLHAKVLEKKYTLIVCDKGSETSWQANKESNEAVMRCPVAADWTGGADVA